MQVPDSVQVVRRPDEVDLVEIPDPLRECCGELTLLAVQGSRLNEASLSVPPPRPFSPSDLRQMWESRNRLAVALRPATSGRADWAEVELEAIDQARLEALPVALGRASRLVGSWPEEPSPWETILPVDRSGGSERLRATERLAERIGVANVDGRFVPARSVRRMGGVEPRRLRAVAAIATQLHKASEALLSQDTYLPDARRRSAVLRPLVGVALQARPVANRLDGPPSTWPLSMRFFYSAASEALAEIRSVGVGQDSAPLSELWELYQMWVTERIFHHSVDCFGEPTTTDQRPMKATWRVGSSVVEIYATPTIPASESRSFRVSGASLRSSISDLQPDILMVHRDRRGVRLLVVDPKKRGFLTRGDLATESSKYLWGIRGADDLVGVWLVSASGGAQSATSEGRAFTREARPIGAALCLDDVRDWWRSLDVDV